MIPFEIRTIHNPDDTVSLKAVIAMEDANGTTLKEIDKIEKQFKIMVAKVKDLINKIDSTRYIKTRPDLHWDVGKIVKDFTDDIETKGYYCTNISRILAENTNKKDRYWSYKIRFVEYYPDKKMLNEKINYKMYQGLLDVADAKKRKRLENDVINGKIKSGRELIEIKVK